MVVEAAEVGAAARNHIEANLLIVVCFPVLLRRHLGAESLVSLQKVALRFCASVVVSPYISQSCRLLA